MRKCCVIGKYFGIISISFNRFGYAHDQVLFINMKSYPIHKLGPNNLYFSF